jgi:uncharacterized protein
VSTPLRPPSPRKHLDRVLDANAREFYDRLERGELATTRCAACGRTDFPPRERCARCGGSTEWVDLPRHGTVESFTSQERGLRFTAPAVLGLVRLGDVVLPGIVEAPLEDVSVGQAVTVELRREDELGLTLLHFQPTPGS